MRLILLGAPGAGKGTQAKEICAKYLIPQISTGNILRLAIEKESDLGKQVKALVESGRYVPDEIVIQLVTTRLQETDCQSGFLLDGFPRTLTQASALQEITPIDYVIDIDVPEDEIVKRLSGRRLHPASGRTYHIYYQPPKIANQDDITGEPLIQRPDDSEVTIRKRLHIYQTQTTPLREFYKKLNSYIKIDGTGSIQSITKDIFNILHKKEHVS